MYITTKETYGKYEILRVTNKTTGEYFSVIPQLGGRVQEIGLCANDKIIQILENEKDPEAFGDERWYRGVILIPFPNRVRGGEYEYEGTTQKLSINMPSEGHAIHGIMYNKSFTVDDSKDNVGTLTLEHNYDGSAAGYPFPSLVKYIFSLTDKGFACSVSITNLSTTKIPFGVGWHPYYTLGSEVDMLELKLPKVASIEVDEAMIPTGRKDTMDDYRSFAQIDDTKFDKGFEIIEKGEVVITEVRNFLTDITLHAWQKSGPQGFNYVQIFTPPGRSSIAIEPMTCPADSFNSKESLVELDPQETWVGEFGVSLK